MDRLQLPEFGPDSVTWAAAASLLAGSYFDQPLLTALGFGAFGLLILASTHARQPLGWKWIPLRLRYAWSLLLGSWLILAALGATPLVYLGEGQAAYIWRTSDEFDITAASEASMNFDQEDVRSFLGRVGGVVDGLPEGRVDRIAAEIAETPLDVTRQWEHVVDFRGVETTLVLHAFMDDVAAPDLHFFTSPELAGAIQELMEQFAHEMEGR